MASVRWAWTAVCLKSRCERARWEIEELCPAVGIVELTGAGQGVDPTQRVFGSPVRQRAVTASRQWQNATDALMSRQSRPLLLTASAGECSGCSLSAVGCRRSAERATCLGRVSGSFPDGGPVVPQLLASRSGSRWRPSLLGIIRTVGGTIHALASSRGPKGTVAERLVLVEAMTHPNEENYISSLS